MGHTKHSVWSEKLDRHEQRNDISNVRGDIKKHGAGAGNWGQLGDEVLEERRLDVQTEQSSSIEKLQVLNKKQFTSLRRWSR